jgi:uncharacterized protein YecE (DUF72 family)
LSVPEALGKAEVPGLLSGLIDAIEVNAAFFAIPSPGSAADLLESTSDNPDFRFSIKLHNVFSHHRSFRDTDVGLFSEYAGEFLRAGRLVAVLVQFPSSFRYGIAAKAYVKRLRDTFLDFPLVVETRHRTFEQPEFDEFLSRLAVGRAYADGPRSGGTPAPDPWERPSTTAYFSLHGRDANRLSRHDSDPAKYDYLYSRGELEELADRIEKDSPEAEESLVIFNNTLRGQALVNALQLKAMLLGRPVAAPSRLIGFYPGSEDLFMNLPPGPSDTFPGTPGGSVDLGD